VTHGPRTDDFRLPTIWHPGYHTEAARWLSTRKQRDVVAGADAAGLIDLVTPTFDEPATWRDIATLHAPPFVEAVRSGEPRALAESQGFQWSPAFASAVVRIWEGHAIAARLALAGPRRLVFHPVSGAHHAHPDEGAGFCTFNFLVGAAVALLREGRVRRVAILDLDAHPGDGTYAFVRAGAVPRDAMALFDISGSRWGLVPRDDLTMYLTAADADDYAARLAELPRFLDRAAPDLVFYQAGMDPHERDPIGGIAGVTWETLAARDRLVFDLCVGRSLPTVVNLAGGYQEDGSTVRGHVETFRQAWAACGRA
jgi:acetoin utilization deacetylase AcuC-like enzyme